MSEERKMRGSILNGEELEYLKQEGAGMLLLRSYMPFCLEEEMYEKNRPSLMEMAGISKATSNCEAIEKATKCIEEGALLQEDERVLRRYSMCRRMKDIVDTALSERMTSPKITSKGFTRSEDTPSYQKAVRAVNVLRALYCDGISVNDAMDRFGISYATVKRIKRKGAEAVRNEIMLRLAAHKLVSETQYQAETEGAKEK